MSVDNSTSSLEFKGPLIELSITAGRVFPGEFLAHPLLHEFPPLDRTPGVAVGGLPDGTEQGPGRHIAEDKDVAGSRPGVVGANRLPQTVGGPDGRDRIVLDVGIWVST